MVLASTGYGQELAYNSPQTPSPKKCECKELKRIDELGGEVVIDGSLRVLEANQSRIIDMVEISTPVVSGSNHARLFLRADGSKSSLVIGWDDGTYTRITGN